MHYPLRGISLLVLALSGCAKPDTTLETMITTEDGKVSAVFPHQPHEMKGDKAVIFDYDSRNFETSFILNQFYFPAPIDLADKDLVRGKFEDSRDDIVRELKGTILTQKPLELSGIPGYTYDAEGFGKVHRSRMYFTRTYSVTIGVSGSKAFVDGPEAANFLDSLKLEQ